MRRRRRVVTAVAVALVVIAPPGTAVSETTRPASASAPVVSAATSADRVVETESGLRRAWADPRRRRIDLGADIALRDCVVGDPIRESPYPIVVHGHGHVLRQTCFEKRLLRQDGTGYLVLRDLTLTRGGSDGPGAAVTSRGEITILDSVIKQNLSEEPGGGVFSMRRVTVRRSRINGNLANDDGGGVYARRGGVQVYDSVLSNNLVDGSGGAIGSTGDILVVRSQVDGNTTDGDGGALYADEDGDVTVIGSLVDGSDADGPGGAIFTLDGDVAVLDSTLIGNRADDRGGAVAGEADVLVVNSTVARNLAVAHAGGGVWARGNLMLINATVTDNYAEGEGGGTLAAGRTSIFNSTITTNIASIAANVGSAGRLTTTGTIIGPATFVGVTGDTIPTQRSCRVYESVSGGYNFLTDQSCELDDPRDVYGDEPMLARLEDDPKGFVLVPLPGSPVLQRVPSGTCVPDLPERIPAGQLLEPYLDWETILQRDAIGTVRDTGAPCDVGAVESPPAVGPAPRAVPGAGAPPDPRTGRGPARVARPRTEHSRPISHRAAPRVRPGVGRHELRRLSRILAGLGTRSTRLQKRARRFTTLLGCTTSLRVDRLGDPRHRWGYLYDERDGNGVYPRSALTRHFGRSRADLRLLRLGRRPRCLSAVPDPNGAGANARTRAPGSTRKPTVARLQRQVRRLERRIRRTESVTDRFDDWESCLSWLPVTEDGDLRQNLGFAKQLGGDPTSSAAQSTGPGAYAPAIDLDHSEWDDPDYQLLAFVGRDRPFGPGECRNEPGEAPDRSVAGPDRAPVPRPRGALPRTTGRRGSRTALHDLRVRIVEARESLADLRDPVQDITRFDQCMYTVGMQSRGGYLYRTRHGVLRQRRALSFDLRGQRLPAHDVMAFPGEEPPQIECNEDAGGGDDDE